MNGETINFAPFQYISQTKRICRELPFLRKFVMIYCPVNSAMFYMFKDDYMTDYCL